MASFFFASFYFYYYYYLFSLYFNNNGKDFNIPLTPIILDLKCKTILCTVFVYVTILKGPRLPGFVGGILLDEIENGARKVPEGHSRKYLAIHSCNIAIQRSKCSINDFQPCTNLILFNSKITEGKI